MGDSFEMKSRKILSISKNKVPLVSENPPLDPAIEKDWQGNPPVSKSIFLPIDLYETSTTDPSSVAFGKNS